MANATKHGVACAASHPVSSDPPYHPPLSRILTPLLTTIITVKHVRFGAVRVHEYDQVCSSSSCSESGGEEESPRTQRAIPPPEKKEDEERELWGPVRADDIWQSCPDYGIWGSVEED